MKESPIFTRKSRDFGGNRGIFSHRPRTIVLSLATACTPLRAVYLYPGFCFKLGLSCSMRAGMGKTVVWRSASSDKAGRRV